MCRADFDSYASALLFVINVTITFFDTWNIRGHNRLAIKRMKPLSWTDPFNIKKIRIYMRLVYFFIIIIIYFFLM